MTSAANSKDEAEEPAGTLGRFRLLADLGQGGMGTIHVALSSGIGVFKKLVVLKELRRELTKNEKFVEMFLRDGDPFHLGRRPSARGEAPSRR